MIMLKVDELLFFRIILVSLIGYLLEVAIVLELVIVVVAEGLL